MAAIPLQQELFSTFGPSIAVGVISAAANVVEKQAREKGNTNEIFKNASLWGDIAIGGYSVINYSMNQPMFPSDLKGVTAMAGAGIALLSRRAADWLGATVLNLPTGVNRLAPGRSMGRGRPALRRAPGAAVETGVMPRKRQFFSVT